MRLAFLLSLLIIVTQVSSFRLKRDAKSLDQLKAAAAAAAAKLAEEEGKISATQTNLTAKEAELKEAQTQFEEKTKTIATVKLQLNATQTKLANLTSDFETKSKAVESAKSSLDQVQAVLDNVTRSRDSEQAGVDEKKRIYEGTVDGFAIAMKNGSADEIEKAEGRMKGAKGEWAMAQNKMAEGKWTEKVDQTTKERDAAKTSFDGKLAAKNGVEKEKNTTETEMAKERKTLEEAEKVRKSAEEKKVSAAKEVERLKGVLEHHTKEFVELKKISDAAKKAYEDAKGNSSSIESILLPICFLLLTYW